MSNIKSEFEKLPIIQEIITDEDYGLMFDESFSKYLCLSDGNEEYLNGAWMVWQHQQSKIDELQKENDALVHVIKSRDIQLENEKHEYDELMNKLVDSGMKNAELQKRVDAALKMISSNGGFAWRSESISQLEQVLKGGRE